MPSDTTHFSYSLFGLVVHSDLELPELARFDPGAPENLMPAEVEILLGSVPLTLSGSQVVEGVLEFTKSACLHFFPGLARFLVEDGCKISIEMETDAPPDDVRLYLLGSVFATLLHQRKLIPLHVSAVVTPKGIVAFTGDSGAGKSTIAALLHKQTNWPMISDDVAVLRPSDEMPTLYGGMLRIKLWKDAIGLLKIDQAKTFRDAVRFEKYHLRAPEQFAQQPLELAALIELQQGDANRLQPLGGAETFELVMNSIYRPYLVGMFGDRDTVVRKSALVANQIQGYSLTRQWSVQGLYDSACLIGRHFGE